MLGINFAIIYFMYGGIRAGCDRHTLIYSTDKSSFDIWNSNKKLYEEINCVPNKIINKKNGKWLKLYECGNLLERAKDKCYYVGKEYSKGEGIPVMSSDSCYAACSCKLDHQGFAGISCARIECPNLFSEIPKAGCTYKYDDINGCCPVLHCRHPGEIECECVFGGRKYKEGSKFYLGRGGDEKECVCKKDFSQGYFERNCRNTRCGYELNYGGKIRRKCAPVFFESVDGCPIEWKCADDVKIPEIIQSSFVPLGSNGEKGMCDFGKFKLNVGDELRAENDGRNEYRVDCSCNVPPLVTCVYRKYRNITNAYLPASYWY